MTVPPISLLPPELLYVILELAVEGLPATLRIRSSILRSFSLVASDWRIPAQTLLESRVHIDSYQRARAFLDRPRRLERPLVMDELVLFYDFAPQDDELFPLTEFMTKSLCEMDCTIRFLHLRSALFTNAFDTGLLLLPSFRDLRHLKLDLPLEPPPSLSSIPLRLTTLSLSTMVDQPPSLFKSLLSASADTLTALHLFVIKSGAPLHDHLLAALPSITSTLRHLSISTHWIALPESLLRFIIDCDSLQSLTLTGVDLPQIRYLLTSTRSRLLTFDFSVPSSDTSIDSDFPAIFDELLSAGSMRQCRFIRALRRVETGAQAAAGEGSRVGWVREGGQRCSCVYEVTTPPDQALHILIDLELGSGSVQ
ncbi:hypothetical protein JCM6882_000480 [Rhodosporidiobolus microsporus]